MFHWKSAVLFLWLCALVLAGKDYYNVLGVSRDASKDEIRRAYKRLSIKYHPDKNPGDDTASKKFIEVANAYEVLTDEQKRSVYDRFGEEGLKNGGGDAGDFHDPFDIFAQFARGFGGGGRREARERKGPEIRMPLDVDLKDLFAGKVIEVEVDRQGLCPSCDGSGAKSSKDVHVCSACNGQGVKVVKQMIAPGFFQQMQTTCDKCGGKGKIVKANCPRCHGHKVIRDTEIIDVAIERGMQDGDVISFEGTGDQSPDYSPGDLHFIINQIPHPTFTRRGDNLYAKEAITLVEALNGFEHEITHLDGSKIKLSRKSVTAPGYVQIIDKEGMPLRKSPKKRGKLYVEYSVVFPVGMKFNDDQQEQIRQLFGQPSGSASARAKETAAASD